MFFRKTGAGDPLVILHGLYGSSDNWMGIARRLAEQYTVFSPDLRNHGLSPHGPEHTYAAMKADLAEFFEVHI
ncbi:MAG TPA: alpha/beta fold hydrolase, partial [Prolixibacteraceae bacterium]|nr:alpha/beta fold hydrolase [Prolixibacteraceae bacterium]